MLFLPKFTLECLILKKLMLGFLCLFKVLKQNLILYRESYTAFFFHPRCKTALNLLHRSAGTEEVKYDFVVWVFLNPLFIFFSWVHEGFTSESDNPLGMTVHFKYLPLH